MLQCRHVHESAGPEDAVRGREPWSGHRGRSPSYDDEAHDHLDECDILLLGPQIGYTKGDFEKEAAGRFPVEVINMVDYGRMNAAGIIDHCVSVMG